MEVVAFDLLQNGSLAAEMGFRYEPGSFEVQEKLPHAAVFSPHGEVHLGLHAFESLILRYFQEIITCAVQVRHLAIQMPSWIKFEGEVSEIKVRLEKGE